MARVLRIDRKFYGPDGLVRLYRGDDWFLYGKVVDVVNGYETDVDLSRYSATAYFPSATGCDDLPATAATGCCAELTLTMPAASTPQVGYMNGQSIYAVLSNSEGQLETVVTSDTPVWVGDRGFYQDY